MQHTAVLDIRILTNGDKLHIAAKDRVPPDAGIAVQPYFANNRGRGGYEIFFALCTDPDAF